MEMFAKAFHEVVPPLLEELKEEIISTLSDKFEQLERKVENITDSHAVRLGNHERRIKALEKRKKITS